jgi:membrane protease YdiL (CAAX protease family)
VKKGLLTSINPNYHTLLEQNYIFDKKKTIIALLLVVLFLLPPLHLLFIPLYLFSKFYQSEHSSCKWNITYTQIIIYSLISIISVNLISGSLFANFPLQSNVSQIKESFDISITQLFSILLISPIIEELYFRGILFESLRHRQPILISFCMTSALFAIIHFNIISSPTLFVLGLSLALLRLYSNRIIYSIIMHAIFNSIMLLFILE